MRYQAVFERGTDRARMEREAFSRARREGLKPTEVLAVRDHSVQWGEITIVDVECQRSPRTVSSDGGPVPTDRLFKIGAGDWMPTARLTATRNKRRAGAY